MISCWHRPGKMSPSGKLVTCRNCGALIEWCPCVGETFRSCDKNCVACLGSMWVATMRSRLAKFRDFLGVEPTILTPVCALPERHDAQENGKEGNFDRGYWGPGGIDISRWKGSCMRGLEYIQVGAPVPSGTKAQVRKFSSGRKARGMASDFVKDKKMPA